MTLKKINSRIYIVNLFADFILSKIPNTEESIITIVDCTNFLIIKGKTTYKEILDIYTLSNEFNEKHSPKFPISHTIDLVEYNCKLPKIKNLSFTLHRSDNCSYHKDQIKNYLTKDSSFGFDYTSIEITDESLVTVSEFPHGYSINQGRLIYLYGKHIFYNIPLNYPVSSLSFNLSTEKNNDGDNIVSIYNPFNESYDNTLESAILDVFDFDMSWISLEIKKVDMSVELTNPLYDYNFIKKINKEFVIF